MSGQSTVQDPPIRPRRGQFPLSWNSAEIRPGIRLVAVAGELDILTSSSLLVALQRPENIGATHLVIDLAQVDFLAGAGINALIDVARCRPRQHTHLVVPPSKPAVARVIGLTGAAELLTVNPDLERCLRSLDQT